MKAMKRGFKVGDRVRVVRAENVFGAVPDLWGKSGVIAVVYEMGLFGVDFGARIYDGLHDLKTIVLPTTGLDTETGYYIDGAALELDKAQTIKEFYNAIQGG